MTHPDQVLEPLAAEEMPRKANATQSSCPPRRCLQAPSRAPDLPGGMAAPGQLSLGAEGSSSQSPGPEVVPFGDSRPWGFHPFWDDGHSQDRYLGRRERNISFTANSQAYFPVIPQFPQ